MNVTQLNYANQLKRLSQNEKRANRILIYYSMALIVYALSIKFYPSYFDETWISYSSIIFSIVLLIYSIVNSNAGYPKRIAIIEDSLNRVKKLKREMKSIQDSDKERFEELKKKYDKVATRTEMRDDIDFYHTIRQLCKQYHLNPLTGKSKNRFHIFKKNNPHTSITDVSEQDSLAILEIQSYISENNPKLQAFHVFLNSIWHLTLFFAPVLIFIVGFTSHNHHFFQKLLTAIIDLF